MVINGVKVEAELDDFANGPVNWGDEDVKRYKVYVDGVEVASYKTIEEANNKANEIKNKTYKYGTDVYVETAVM